ncbi:MAG: pyridoxine 5'-phosphate synthase [Verrucomicrobiota bacterium]|nr:pyridoxine 5'-phosphate synthase [Verrucomicrobiota bacterium]
MLKLGINIDHVATVRQARLAEEPSPVKAAVACEIAGCDGITAHLREDRRHINDKDMETLRRVVRRLNMEMGLTDEMIEKAIEIRPDSVCIVPEKRQELTTEGGLDVIQKSEKLLKSVPLFQEKGIYVSLFIDPDELQIRAAAKTGAEYIELHTGAFANSATEEAQAEELERLRRGAELAVSLGLRVNAGHGIDYYNIEKILEIPYLEELNIGHSIIARAIYVGIDTATVEMKELMSSY